MNRFRIIATLASLLVVVSGAIVGCEPESQPPPVERDTGQPDAGEPEDVEDEDADVDVDPPAPPQMEVSPDSITFEGIEIDDTETAQVTVDNTGEADLTVEDVELSIENSQDHQLVLGEDSAELPVEVPSDQLVDFYVEYTPIQAGSTTGEVVIESDAEDEPVQSIRIETVSAYAELEAPDRITFDALDPGDSQTIEQLKIANRGMQTLQVDDIYVDPDSSDPDAFSIEVIDATGTVDFPASRDRHAFWYLNVTFEPDDDELKTAEIVIESNDPAHEEYIIEVSGNHAEPCLSTSGNLDFGEMSDGEEITDTVTLLNCSLVADLEVTDIEIADDGDGVFELVDEVDDPVELEPTQTYDFEVRATMVTDQDVKGLLTMSSNDPEASEVELELRARPD